MVELLVMVQGAGSSARSWFPPSLESSSSSEYSDPESLSSAAGSTSAWFVLPEKAETAAVMTLDAWVGARLMIVAVAFDAGPGSGVGRTSSFQPWVECVPSSDEVEFQSLPSSVMVEFQSEPSSGMVELALPGIWSVEVAFLPWCASWLPTNWLPPIGRPTGRCEASPDRNPGGKMPAATAWATVRPASGLTGSEPRAPATGAGAAPPAACWTWPNWPCSWAICAAIAFGSSEPAAPKTPAAVLPSPAGSGALPATPESAPVAVRATPPSGEPERVLPTVDRAPVAVPIGRPP